MGKTPSERVLSIQRLCPRAGSHRAGLTGALVLVVTIFASTHDTRASAIRRTAESSKMAADDECTIRNPIVLKGEVKAFGTHGRACRLKGDDLVLNVTDRDGDFGMCCVDLDSPLSLKGQSELCAKVEVEHPEKKVDVKLEVHDSAKHIFVSHEEPATGQTSFSHQLTTLEKKWHPDRICFASLGDGHTPNVLRLRSIGFTK